MYQAKTPLRQPRYPFCPVLTLPNVMFRPTQLRSAGMGGPADFSHGKWTMANDK